MFESACDEVVAGRFVFVRHGDAGARVVVALGAELLWELREGAFDLRVARVAL